MNHIYLALIIQLALWFVPPPWNASIAISLIFFWREVTQAEYRWIEAHGGLRAAMPWWQGADVRLWDWHSRRNALQPAAAVLLIAFLAPRLILLFTR